MKAVRTIGILVLVAVLLLGSVGTVFAAKPTDVPRGKRHGFAGNVTAVNVDDGNITIRTKLGNVTLMLTGETRYKIPGVMNKWEGNLTKFKSKGELGEDLAALKGRRVVALAGNVTEAPPGPFTGEALKLMLLPEQGVPGLPPLHAHRTGVVTDDFTPGGNVTIEDVHGVSHTFVIDEATTCRMGRTTIPLTKLAGRFVTVVTLRDPKLEPAAKAIVVHHRIPEGWPTPTPTP